MASGFFSWIVIGRNLGSFLRGFLSPGWLLGGCFLLDCVLGGMILGAGKQKKYQLSSYKKRINMISITNWMASTELTELEKG
jgi:hypothetical protein